MSDQIGSIRKSLGDAAKNAKAWYEASSTEAERAEFLSKSKKGQSPTCSVYVYFDADGSALYVGQSKRRIKARMHDQTSSHRLKEWWNPWQSVRFMRIDDQTDRLVVEMLLILAYRPRFNISPAGKDIQTLLDRPVDAE